MGTQFDDIQTIHYLSDVDDDNNNGSQHNNRHMKGTASGYASKNRPNNKGKGKLKRAAHTSHPHPPHHQPDAGTLKHKRNGKTSSIQPTSHYQQEQPHRHNRSADADGNIRTQTKPPPTHRALHEIESRLNQIESHQKQRRLHRKQRNDTAEQHAIQHLKESLHTLNLHTAAKSEEHLELIKKLNHTHQKWISINNHTTHHHGNITAVDTSTKDNASILTSTTQQLIHQQNDVIADALYRSLEMNDHILHTHRENSSSMNELEVCKEQLCHHIEQEIEKYDQMKLNELEHKIEELKHRTHLIEQRRNEQADEYTKRIHLTKQLIKYQQVYQQQCELERYEREERRRELMAVQMKMMTGGGGGGDDGLMDEKMNDQVHENEYSDANEEEKEQNSHDETARNHNPQLFNNRQTYPPQPMSSDTPSISKDEVTSNDESPQRSADSHRQVDTHTPTQRQTSMCSRDADDIRCVTPTIINRKEHHQQNLSNDSVASSNTGLVSQTQILHSQRQSISTLTMPPDDRSNNKPNHHDVTHAMHHDSPNHSNQSTVNNTPQKYTNTPHLSTSNQPMRSSTATRMAQKHNDYINANIQQQHYDLLSKLLSYKTAQSGTTELLKPSSSKRQPTPTSYDASQPQLILDSSTGKPHVHRQHKPSTQTVKQVKQQLYEEQQEKLRKQREREEKERLYKQELERERQRLIARMSVDSSIATGSVKTQQQRASIPYLPLHASCSEEYNGDRNSYQLLEEQKQKRMQPYVSQSINEYDYQPHNKSNKENLRHHQRTLHNQQREVRHSNGDESDQHYHHQQQQQRYHSLRQKAHQPSGGSQYPYVEQQNGRAGKERHTSTQPTLTSYQRQQAVAYEPSAQLELSRAQDDIHFSSDPDDDGDEILEKRIHTDYSFDLSLDSDEKQPLKKPTSKLE